MKWFIPGNVPSSKNGRRWTGKYFVSSKAVVKYRKDTASYFEKFRKSFRKELAKLELPVRISFKFIRGSKHKFDYINPAQTVQHRMIWLNIIGWMMMIVKTLYLYLNLMNMIRRIQAQKLSY